MAKAIEFTLSDGRVVRAPIDPSVTQQDIDQFLQQTDFSKFDISGFIAANPGATVVAAPAETPPGPISTPGEDVPAPADQLPAMAAPAPEGEEAPELTASQKAAQDFWKATPAATPPEGGAAPVAPEDETTGLQETGKVFAGLPGNVATTVGNLAAGAVRGAGTIGSTLLGQTAQLLGDETPEESAQYTAQMDPALRSLGADTESPVFGVGKFGAEVAGTLGIGGVLGKAAGALGAPALQTALQTGGIANKAATGSTAFQKLGQGLLNTGAGVTVGGVTGAALNPTAEGAGIGSAVGGALVPLLRVGAVGAKYGGRIGNYLWDAANGLASKVKAAQIARDALGPDFQQAMTMLRAAASGQHAGQATADMTSPLWQSLISRVLKRDPRFLENLEKAQGEVSLKALQRLAQGDTATDVLKAQKDLHELINDILIPDLKRELAAANAAGKMVPGLEADIARFTEAASQSVTDVGRFTAAGERATAAAPYWRPSSHKPGGFNKPGEVPRSPRPDLTYAADLAGRAEVAANDAAKRSLLFGSAKRWKQAMLDSLEAHGLRPLKSAPIIKQLTRMRNDPNYAGSGEIQNSLTQVMKDLEEWTNADGVITAEALDAIRKFSVNEAIRKMYPNMDAKSVNKLAAGVMARVKPFITEAMEKAGGTGYGKYLEDYSSAIQQQNLLKLNAKALEMFKKNPESFIALVNGESPKTVEKILGAGQYNIATEVGNHAFDQMKKVAAQLMRDAKIGDEASKGHDALVELLAQHVKFFRLPGLVNRTISAINMGADLVGDIIGKSASKRLTEAMQDPQKAADLISVLSRQERQRFMGFMSDPKQWEKLAPAGATAATGQAAAAAQ